MLTQHSGRSINLEDIVAKFNNSLFERHREMVDDGSVLKVYLESKDPVPIPPLPEFPGSAVKKLVGFMMGHLGQVSRIAAAYGNDPLEVTRRQLQKMEHETRQINREACQFMFLTYLGKTPSQEQFVLWSHYCRGLNFSRINLCDEHKSLAREIVSCYGVPEWISEQVLVTTAEMLVWYSS